MSEIININNAPSFIAPVHPSPITSPSREASSVESADRADSVEISGWGRVMSRIMGDSSLRIARINAIKAEIADGTFETPERIQGTVDRLMDVLG